MAGKSSTCPDLNVFFIFMFMGRPPACARRRCAVNGAHLDTVMAAAKFSLPRPARNERWSLNRVADVKNRKYRDSGNSAAIPF